MKVCSLYGAGFYYIPGTDICMKVGGYVRFQQNFGTTDITAGPFAGVGALNNREASADQAYRTRAIASFDTRQQTAYGTLRTYLILGFSQDSGTDADITPAVRGANVNRLYTTRAFIQIAGFTFGKATSFYDFFSSAAVAYNAGSISSPDTGDAGHVVAAYTAQFGNGLSATISAEQERQRGTVYAPVGAAQAASNLGGANRLQDIVGNIRIDQAWGSAQISAALHDASASYYGAGPGGVAINEWNGHPDSKWGWAVSGGLRLNAPMIGPGDYFQIQANYTEGALQYASNTPGGPYRVKQGQGFGIGFVEDAVFTGTAAAPGIFDLTTAWSVAASYEHFWTPSLRTSIYGSFFDVSRGDAANNALCATTTLTGLGAATSRAAGCDLDHSYWVVGTRSQWNVTKDLYVGVDVLYSKLNSAKLNTAGTYTAVAGNGVAAGAYTTADQDALSVAWRIHRDIVP